MIAKTESSAQTLLSGPTGIALGELVPQGVGVTLILYESGRDACHLG